MFRWTGHFCAIYTFKVSNTRGIWKFNNNSSVFDVWCSSVVKRIYSAIIFHLASEFQKFNRKIKWARESFSSAKCEKRDLSIFNWHSWNMTKVVLMKGGKRNKSKTDWPQTKLDKLIFFFVSFVISSEASLKRKCSKWFRDSSDEKLIYTYCTAINIIINML